MARTSVVAPSLPCADPAIPWKAGQQDTILRTAQQHPGKVRFGAALWRPVGRRKRRTQKARPLQTSVSWSRILLDYNVHMPRTSIFKEIKKGIFGRIRSRPFNIISITASRFVVEFCEFHPLQIRGNRNRKSIRDRMCSSPSI